MEWYHMICIICWLFMSNCGNAIYNDDFKRISCFGPNGLFFPFFKRISVGLPFANGTILDSEICTHASERGILYEL